MIDPDNVGDVVQETLTNAFDARRTVLEARQCSADQLNYAARKMVIRGRKAHSIHSRRRFNEAAANLRLMATLVLNGTATLEAADDWIDAASTVLGSDADS